MIPEEVFSREQILREVSPVGNGAHVFTPKEWIGEKVVVLRSLENPLKRRILKVLEPYLENILGVYLYGSYARNEQREDSDIDLLVISNKRFIIKEKGFEIAVIRKDEIKEDIKIAPVLIYSALNEAKPIINSELLGELKRNYKPKAGDFRGFIRETKNIIKINKELLSPYSIILRLRSVYIIENVLKGKKYSHKGFKEWVLKNIDEKVDFDNVYRVYIREKMSLEGSVKNKSDLIKLLSVLEIKTRKLESKLWPKEKRDLKKQ
jgi:predicted nucleotidyltransferase